MQWTGSPDGRLMRWRQFPPVPPAPAWLKVLEAFYWTALDAEIKAAQVKERSIEGVTDVTRFPVAS